MIKPKLAILDVDGVLCKGKIYDSTGKTVSKIFNDKDFTAIKELKLLGIPVVFLSGDLFNVGIAQKRNIPFHLSRDKNNIMNKLYFVDKIRQKYNVEYKDIIYVGDDRYDEDVLKNVGWPFCPKDACPMVKSICSMQYHVLNVDSGDGVICELLNYLLSIINNDGNYLIPIVLLPDLIKLDAEEHGC